MTKLILATQQGIVTCEREGDYWIPSARGLTDQQATSVAAREGVILAGTTDGVFRSDDEGVTWQPASLGITSPHIRWIAPYSELPNLTFAGTEPANIFVSQDSGDSWRLCPEVAQLRDRFKWSLPYSPEAGCVRGFAFHGSRVYAA